MKIIYIIFLHLFSTVYAQEAGDSLKVISYEDQIILRLNTDTNIEEYILNDKLSDLKSTVAINSKIKTSVGIDYKFISASVSFTPSFFPGNNEDNLKGKSTYTNIKLQFFPGRFLQQLQYKNVKGFYIENTHDYLAGWQKGKDQYIQIPELRVQTFGGSTSYFLNKEFSLKSLLFQREWQDFSSGSLVPSIDYDLTYFTNEIPDDNSIERQINVSAKLAYYYNFVASPKFNIAPYLSAGIGTKFSKFKDDEYLQNDSQDTYFTYQYSGGIQAGYNVKKFFFGGKINYSSYNYNEHSYDSINNNNFYGLLYIGYRFIAPKSVQKAYDKIHKNIPFL